MSEAIRILHVDDDDLFLSTSADVLERKNDEFEVLTATDPREGREMLTEDGVDCVVSDYEMPRENGIEFLESVREERPSLPFILFTGKGSEEIASEALSAGATDYLQKKGSTSQYAVLANRIRNAVSQYRAELRSEAEQRRRERMLDRFIDGYVAFDEQLRFTQVNESAAAFLDASREEILGKHYDDVRADEGGDALSNAYERAMETGEPQTVEARSGVHPDKWVEARVFPIEDGLSVYFRDITERKVIERERERFSTLFEKFPEPTIEYEYVDGEPHIRAVNDAFEKTFGYDTDTAVGKPIDELIVPSEKQVEARNIDERVREGELLDVELRRQTVDGDRYFNFRNITNPVDEDIDGYAVYTDIDERKQRAAELEEKNERLEQFARIVSHDLRNPLNVAESRLTLVQDEYDSPHLDAIQRAHDRIEAIVEDTLLLTQQEETIDRRTEVALEQAVRKCWQSVATGDATLEVTDGCTVQADADRLRHVFENLFRNAVEHGSASSRPEADDSAEHSGDDVTITVGTLEDGFYVADDGSGVPEEVREDIFEFGTSTAEHGTGFGLPIVESIVDAHGWDISVTDSEDGGARFEITGVRTD